MSRNSVFIIAEAGVNHNGSLEMAKRLVDVACESGADAVKFQTFSADDIVTQDVEMVRYQAENVGRRGTQYELLKSLELSYAEFRELKSYCDERGIVFLSTPFDERSARFLIDELGLDILKIPSGEVVNVPYLRFLSKFNIPVILSTGMSSLEEVRDAVQALREGGGSFEMTLLHCTTSYPCAFEHVNLRAMQTLRETFGLEVGYSDHTMGMEVAIAAVALGATVIEKHFTLDRGLPGPDHKSSLLPHELKQMVSAIRNVEASLGDGVKRPTQKELEVMSSIRKSIVTSKELRAGSLLKLDDICVKRARGEIAPKEMTQVIGRVLKRDVPGGKALSWSDIQ